MKKIIIGTKGEFIDLDVLLTTRLLIQANSGGGKSYLIRRLVEQVFGKVQIIIIDPEGEFSTLREKFDFVLVGKGGETPADVRSAQLLAERLLQLNVSAVCDIYEMKSKEKHLWVKTFLDAMVNAPKNLWHPVIVILDEAHIFGPEKGQGESAAYDAVADIASRGRKRGFCLVAATQRLGKLSKNISAELQNVLIGSAFQDIDRKRAADTLGVLRSDERDFFNKIKLLEPGNFFALGRAISKEVVILKVDKVHTSIPEQGKYKHSVPPSPDNIKALLPKLSDLPKEAEEKALNEAQLRHEIAQLKKQLKASPQVDATEIQKLKNIIREREGTIRSLTHGRDKFNETLNKIKNLVDGVKNNVPVPIVEFPDSVRRHEGIQISNFKFVNNGIGQMTKENIGRCEREIIKFLAMREGKFFNKTQVGVMTGYSSNSGGFNNALSRLNTIEYIRKQGSDIGINENKIQEIIAFLGADYKGNDQNSLEQWLNKLGKCEREIYQHLLNNPEVKITKEELGGTTGYSHNSGGFNNAISKLNTLGLITRQNGSLMLNPELLDV